VCFIGCSWCWINRLLVCKLENDGDDHFHHSLGQISSTSIMITALLLDSLVINASFDGLIGVRGDVWVLGGTERREIHSRKGRESTQ
jgi:hypothetical protein